jgi:hypothetical protein
LANIAAARAAAVAANDAAGVGITGFVNDGEDDDGNDGNDGGANDDDEEEEKDEDGIGIGESWVRSAGTCDNAFHSACLIDKVTGLIFDIDEHGNGWSVT